MIALVKTRKVSYHIPGIEGNDPPEHIKGESWTLVPDRLCPACGVSGTSWTTDTGDGIKDICTTCGTLARYDDPELVSYPGGDPPAFEPATDHWAEILDQLRVA